jgi:hypothetical protein
MPNETTTSADDRALEALLGIIQQANTPDTWEAQNILLRRLALQGDVVGSRVPAPRNITEIGGYLNYLTEIQQSEMRSQALAGILGVAGPNPPLGWVASRPALAMVSLPNDRPEGAAQPAIPLSVAVRSDFAPALQAAQKAIHDQGCFLPLLGALAPLPGSGVAADLLSCLGRTLDLFPGSALLDPAADALVLARPQGSAGAYHPMARAMASGTQPAPANWEALKWDGSACVPVALNATSLLVLEPILAAAGFYPAAPLPVPVSGTDQAWARMSNRTGLVAGRTQLGDELALLHTAAEIAESACASCQHWLWNGTAFAQP